MGLVNDHVSPVELLKSGLLSQAHLIGGDDHIPLPGQYLLTNNTRLQGLMWRIHVQQQVATYPLLLCPNETYHNQCRAPPLELCHPIGQRTLGGYHYMEAGGVPH